MDEIVIAINRKWGQLLRHVDLVFTLENLKPHLLKYNQGLTKRNKEFRVFRAMN